MKNTIKLSHHGLFLARTPLLPLTIFQQWADAPDRRAFVCEMMRQPDMRDALYLASPSLHERCQAHLAKVAADGEAGGGRALTGAQAIEETRLYNALGKYLARAAFRCTPFGMFASITAGSIGQGTDLSALDTARIVPRIRLDFEVQAKIIKWLMNDVSLRHKLSYQRNNSLSSHGNKIYFVEGIDVARFKKYQFNQVEREAYLDSLLALAQQSTPYPLLRQHLIAQTGADAETADTYLNELIDNEILLPDLAIRITGPDSFAMLKEKLLAIGEAGRIAKLESILAQVQAPVQQAVSGTGRAPLLDLAWQQMAELKYFELERKNLFQVDCSRPVPVSLSATLVQRIAQAATLLAELTRRRSSYLDDFKRRFQERYGDKEVALDLLFNDELGIPYPKPGKPISDLLQGIEFPAQREQASEISWGAFETLLFQKFETARTRGDLEIQLSAAEIGPIAAGKTALPLLHGGIHVQATLFASDQGRSAARGESGNGNGNGSGSGSWSGNESDNSNGNACDEADRTGDNHTGIYIQSLGGRTGVELLGRFCDLDESLTQQVRNIIARVDSDDETRIHAEIVHLPQDRIVNIVARPILSQYEIPWLGQSGIDPDRQIPVSDLTVSLREKRFVLRSTRLQKQVIPRLSTAHNILGNNLSLYQFLGSLTYQDQPLLGFDWPSVFRSASFLPRVTLEGATVALACWNLGKDDLASLRSAHETGVAAPDAGLAALQAWRSARHMPRFVSLDVHDNVLPIDLDNAMMVQLLLDEIAGSQRVRLKEALVLNKQPARGRLGQHNLEIILPLQVASPGMQAEAATSMLRSQPAASATLHSGEPWLYIPGSQWLYFKIYCGQSQVDELLGHYLAPLMRQSLRQGQISHWFCLRYVDPEHHLRLRAHASDRASASALHLALSDVCARALQAGFGWKIVCDSYEPEIARYGGLPALAQCEQLFHLDSEILCDFIHSEAAAIPVARRWLFAVLCVDALLDAFGQTLVQKRQLADSVAAAFRQEFQFGARQKVQLGAKYRSYRKELDALILGRESDAASTAQRNAWLALLAPYLARMQQAAAQILALQQAGQLEAPLPDILASLIHMHCNRLFIANQRAHEAVFYDFLQRIYASLAATRPAAATSATGFAV